MFPWFIPLMEETGLILPLDQYAKAYGWDKSYTPETMQQFMWTADGKKFGQGTLFGVAQIIFAFHFLLMRLRIGQPSGEPTLLATPGEEGH